MPIQEVYFNMKIMDQIILITKVFNEIQNGRTLLTSPRGIAFSKSQPVIFFKLLQL